MSTRTLKRLIERRRRVYMWGHPCMITPRLVSKVFGNGQRLIALLPIDFRPNRFVVRIDSSWSLSNWDLDAECGPANWLDGVYDAIEDEFVEWPWAADYGFTYSEDDDADCNSRIDWSAGSAWGEMAWPKNRRRKRRINK